MNALRRHIIETLGVRSEIDPAEEIEGRVKFLVERLASTGRRGYVLGISGGQDSLLAGILAQKAVKRYREASGRSVEFLALKLPYGIQSDADDVDLALKYIKPDHTVTFNIDQAVDSVVCEFEKSQGGYPLSDYHKGNVKARQRMIAQYTYAGDRDLMVIGTDHAAEAVTGFFTKFGDGAADVLPLSGLTKRQGRQILWYLGAPDKIITKAPTADLLDHKPGQADETELGLTYSQIDRYLEGRAQEMGFDIAKRIEERYLATLHKRELPVSYRR